MDAANESDSYKEFIAMVKRTIPGNYWAQRGGVSEISDYITNDVDGVKSAVAQMITGEPVSVLMQEYAASAMKLDTGDRILSAMAVYGFLIYDESTMTVRIPDQELFQMKME